MCQSASSNWRAVMRRGKWILLGLAVLAGSLLVPLSAQAQIKPRAVLDKQDYSYLNWTAAFTKDGKKLASGGPPHTLKLWDVAKGELLEDMGEDKNPDAPSVGALAFSPEGQSLAVGTWLGADVEVWDLGKRKPRLVLTGHEKRVTSVIYSPEGKTLSSASMDGTVRLWNSTSGELQHILKGHPQWASCIVFSPDGKVIFTGSGGGDVFAWDVLTGERLRTFGGHKRPIESLAISEDGATLMSACRDDVVRIWDAKTGKERWAFRAAHYAVMTRDAKYVIAARTRSIEVWSLAERTRLGHYGHRHAHPHAFVLSQDDKTIAYVTDDSRVLLWDVARLLAVVK